MREHKHFLALLRGIRDGFSEPSKLIGTKAIPLAVFPRRTMTAIKIALPCSVGTERVIGIKADQTEIFHIRVPITDAVSDRLDHGAVEKIFPNERHLISRFQLMITVDAIHGEAVWIIHVKVNDFGRTCVIITEIAKMNDKVNLSIRGTFQNRFQ